MTDAGQKNKQEVDYSPGHRDKCKDCRYFIVLMPALQKGRCHKVSGVIDKEYWCKEFQRR